MHYKLRNIFIKSVALAALLALAPTPLLADDGGHGGDGGNEVRFTGTIESLPAAGLFGQWMVAGTQVTVGASTEVRQDDGLAAVGATVEVRGQSFGTGVLASEVRVMKGAVANPFVDFQGAIMTLPTVGLIGDWTVGTMTVHVSALTLISQPTGATVGTTVEVKGMKRADGSVDALTIKVEAAGNSAEFEGKIMVLPSGGLTGDWTVGTTTVHVSATTTIDKPTAAAVGAMVEVKGTKEADGSVDASSIKVEAVDNNVDFEGAIMVLPSGGVVGDWTVGTTSVHVSATTTIDNPTAAVVGAIAEVKGTKRADGSVDASSIKIEAADNNAAFEGVVMALPTGGLIGDWTVGTTTVHVTSSTVIDTMGGAVAVGSKVVVKGVKQADGSVNANEIKVIPAQPGASCPQFFETLKLTPGSSAPVGAEGNVLARHFQNPDGTTRDDLKVAVEGLMAGATFDVIVDGTHAGVIMTDSEGEGSLFLSSASIPGAQPLPAALIPVTNLKHIDIDDSAQAAELSGDFANARVQDCQPMEDEFETLAFLRNVSGTVVGFAEASVHHTVQEFAVNAFGLAPDAQVHIVVDQSDLGAFMTDAHGRLEVVFASKSVKNALPLPPAITPVTGLMHVELQVGGSMVASGDLIAETAVKPGESEGKPRRWFGGHH